MIGRIVDLIGVSVRDPDAAVAALQGMGIGPRESWRAIFLAASVGAILSSDFPLAQGTILVLALGFIVINMIVDMLYAVLDPRAQKS